MRTSTTGSVVEVRIKDGSGGCQPRDEVAREVVAPVARQPLDDRHVPTEQGRDRILRRVQALEGLRVVDMATVLAGPGTAKYLGDFGADVIKVEAPVGDGTRGMGWRDPSDQQTFMWKVLGRNKRAVVLDLKSDAGLDTMLSLIADADGVV
jgi:hypothetical protein